MNIPIDEVVHFDVITSSPTTGAAADADSTPTFEVFEESTDTDIGVGGNLTKRTSKTGNYRGSFTASAANGFEAGKWYSVVASATVGGVAGKAVALKFRAVVAEAVTGSPKVDVGSMGADVLTAAALAADAVSEIQSGLSTLTAAGVRTELATELGRIDVATSSRLASGSYTAPLDAAGTRTAVGLASANLDTQLAAIKSDSAAILDDTGTAGVVVASGSKSGYSLASTGLDAIAVTAPSGVASTFREMVVQLWRRFFKKAVNNPDDSTLKTYADDGTTVVTTQSLSEDADGVETQGAAS